jgi:hypothetical protein
MGGFHDSTGKYCQTRTQKRPLPIGSFHLAAGTPLAAFADGDSDTPGLALDNSEAEGIRWNNHETPLAVVCSLALPNDMKPGSDVVLCIPASKTGATVGDATKFTVAAFNNVVGALRDADANYGGDTDAMTGNATSKTGQKVTRTLAGADLSPGCNVTLSIKPKDGTLGTDDVTISEPYLEYTQVIDQGT